MEAHTGIPDAEGLPTAPHLLIGGCDVAPAGRKEVRNPARPDEVVGLAPQASAQQVELAVTAAAGAAAGWAATPVSERAAVLEKAADLFGPDEAAARLLTREQGKILAESSVELKLLAPVLRSTAALAHYLDDAVHETDRGPYVLRRRPQGVLAAVVPWNWPLLLFVSKVAPALLAGNTVVLKAPDEAPLVLFDVARRLSELLPPGVLNVVAGPVADVAPVLLGHPDVRGVSFTGSTASGRRVMAEAAATVKTVTLELGGNDPALVLDDAVIDAKSVGKLLGGAFATAGQGCQLVKRVYVHRRRYDELVDALVAAADERYVVGDGLRPEATLGPLNSRRQLERVRGFLDAAVADGAVVRHCGRAADDTEFERGHFLRPAFVLDAPDDSAIVADEQFAPALPVLAVDSDDEAVARANQGEHGLCASVWTADESRFWDVARRIEAGTVLHNHHNVLTLMGLAPYGGMKQSGIGRETGLDGLLAHTELQVLTTRKG